ncbi:adenylate/guanylate cyclase domain-containing protein [Reyranella sp.]|uniref:adenylate/guanylate cyclase domain-containing protein n=1 Tax=Reyranella sp. TaxID=1929291 RepID=UPI003BAD3185
MTAPDAAAAIRALRRRYLLGATSVTVIDLASSLIFVALTGAWPYAPRSIAGSLLLLGGANFLLSLYLFAPIDRFLHGKSSFDAIQRRLTQLPLLTARTVGLLTLVLTLARLGAAMVFDDAALADVPRPTIADFISLCVIVPVFYFTYTYFVISDYLTDLCSFIFRTTGHNLGLFFGRYRTKLIVALVVISIAPLAAVIVDLFSYTDPDRLRFEISNDVGVALMGVIIASFFITRSLLRPIRNLSGAMVKVTEGDLSQRVPVTSNDEVGALTAQFNTMVEGLRERERIRETFGRYVDESVATTILRREGDGVLAGETREATILFTDIERFTTIAEHLSPDELVAALNDYLETVLAPIQRHGGVVNTFIGDGLFASFNMPLACEDHACAAVSAAIDIQRAVGGRTFGDFGVAFATRIGICTGRVVGGSVGAGKRVSFTLLGDTVNLASRLEQLNKEYGTRILVSDSTRQACGERFVFSPLGSVVVRGRLEADAVYSIDPNGQETP